jgi:F-type H+-transporting ATPase subunit a
MRLIKQLLVLAVLLAAPVAGWAAEGGEHHGLTTYAPVVLDLGVLKVTNSMIVTWMVALGLILFAKVATKDMKRVPSGLQNFWEWLVESLASFLEGILGWNLAKQTFWFFATVFIFIIFTNWAGLIPGVGSIGWGTPDASGHLHHIDTPVLRGANADLNMTSAMAIVFFGCWIFWAIKANGVGGSLAHVFLYRGDAVGFMKIALILVFLGVGLLEVVSILFRPVSLSFRLYGNIFAGENLLEAMALTGGRYFGWLVPLPFYFMELIVGFVQALVFTLLTAVFTALICEHHEEGHESAEAHGKSEGAHH